MTVEQSEAGGAGEVPSLADTSGLKAPPPTARGARTRAALIAAARTVFERDGFLESRLIDITSSAKCSIGSFYSYFASKEEILQAVIEAAESEMLHPSMPTLKSEGASPVAKIHANNLAYLEAYERNAKLMLILTQLAATDPKFRALQARRSRAFAQRNARTIRELQKQGVADTTLDPYIASCALSGMVSRMAYTVFCLDEPIPTDDLARTLTRLWTNALELS